MTSNFTELIEQGGKSEVLVYQYLTARGWEVEDKTKDPTYQAQDIDFIASKEDSRRTVEVKQDNKCSITGNILLETITNKRNGNIGWFAKCEAEYIIWHDTNNHQLLTVASSDLRAYINMKGTKARYKEWDSWEGYGYKTSCGYLIPLYHFKECFSIGEHSI
jgi:hypothetical protein